MPTPAFKENVKYLLTISFVLSVFTLITFNIQNISAVKKVLGASTVAAHNLESEKSFWESFLKENPTYLDGWIELGQIEAELGNTDASNTAFAKAREIDPNSEKLHW